VIAFLSVFGRLVLERIAAIRGAQNRPAMRQNSADALERLFEGPLRPDQPVEAVRNPMTFQ
jgi:hypothetical protein